MVMRRCSDVSHTRVSAQPLADVRNVNRSVNELNTGCMFGSVAGNVCLIPGDCSMLPGTGRKASHAKHRRPRLPHTLGLFSATRYRKCSNPFSTPQAHRHRRILVSRCFMPSQTQRIISGLRETFIKRYIVERPNVAEIRPKEQNEKAGSCRENLWNEIQVKGS